MSSRNGWDQDKPVAILDGRIHSLQIFDIVFANKEIDKGTQFTAFIEQMRFDTGILSRQIAERI